ncbi:Glutaredoxin-like protein NrdH, required for reduction of Ribonucleotide reductase class Ib [Fructilactobacillus florum 8D]|uniref:Glutaredoxin-like protein NrdH n=1 Tax=Fructilactobacillus florum 8D TaxID=1221538 RepID=W9EGY6_9LACO|nr:glutaredoxin-like protein NrdH [Fructilactobacillus florum]ETO40280.1 Glutaredoxin-like protein NrdH, required for reduction of Ribonucleotide reductase class Ib [Fructilactobacillus florum 8D]
MEKVTVFTKDNCIQCKLTKRFLKEHNVTFTEKNTSTNPELIGHLKKQGFQAVPVVESQFIESFSGFQPANLNKLLAAFQSA